jgi:hypothetical protein
MDAGGAEVTSAKDGNEIVRRNGPITLTNADRLAAMRLLGALQGHLESEIDGCLIPPGNAPMPEDAAAVRKARRIWREAERLVERLEGAGGAKSR